MAAWRQDDPGFGVAGETRIARTRETQADLARWVRVRDALAFHVDDVHRRAGPGLVGLGDAAEEDARATVLGREPSFLPAGDEQVEELALVRKGRAPLELRLGCGGIREI